MTRPRFIQEALPDAPEQGEGPLLELLPQQALIPLPGGTAWTELTTVLPVPASVCPRRGPQPLLIGKETGAMVCVLV